MPSGFYGSTLFCPLAVPKYFARFSYILVYAADFLYEAMQNAMARRGGGLKIYHFAVTNKLFVTLLG